MSDFTERHEVTLKVTDENVRLHSRDQRADHMRDLLNRYIADNDAAKYDPLRKFLRSQERFSDKPENRAANPPLSPSHNPDKH